MNGQLLAAAQTPNPADLQAWRSAVEVGALGYYGRAHVALQTLRRTTGVHPAVISLCWSTAGSLVRQQGGHRAAAVLDGRAFAIADSLTGEWSVAARADSLTGLAADALGQGRLECGHALLARCDQLIIDDRSADAWRLRIRRQWVEAELAMAQGAGGDAVIAAERAMKFANDGPSPRHRAKSGLIYAAALTVSGSPAAASHAREAFEQCRHLGLVPLQWAAAMLCQAFVDQPEAARDAAAAAAEVRLRGGHLG